jgi:hypothetical protein
VVVIQKIARGYIARKTVVRAANIRNGLSAPVLHLAERYMQKGDMWGFLREVEESLARLQVRLFSPSTRSQPAYFLTPYL